MTRYVHRLVMPVVFPAGIHAGAGKDESNRLVISRDGRGRPVLRGSAIAGVLRHAYAASRGRPSRDPEVSRWFGRPCNEDRGDRAGEPSPVRVADMPLESGGDPEVRHHIAIDRHTGAPVDGGLFDVEALAPGTRGTLLIELHGESRDDAEAFFAWVVGLFDAGIHLGGNSNRGIGLARRGGDARWRTFDLTRARDHALLLDERYFARGGALPATGEVLEGEGDPNRLVVEFPLAVPRGQDVLVGNGQAIDCEIEPQRVGRADGTVVWRIPGSTLRGVMRGWVTRLARREGYPVADTVERRRKDGPPKGDELGWGFVDPGERGEIVKRLEDGSTCLEDEVPCPVMRLFGSLFSRGRVQIADAFGGAVDGRSNGPATQRRMHVAVDRITGGAREGFLFDNDVLVSAPETHFPVTMTVENPSETEARWLALTLRAIDRGILRIGSSKSAGRLALAAAPRATGPHADLFESIEPCEVSHV